MLYAAKCYWPGVSPSQFEHETATRLAQSAADDPAYLGALVFGGDALVLCLYEGSSAKAVIAAATRARIPCERVMALDWLPTTDPPLSRSGGLP